MTTSTSLSIQSRNAEAPSKPPFLDEITRGKFALKKVSEIPSKPQPVSDTGLSAIFRKMIQDSKQSDLTNEQMAAASVMTTTSHLVKKLHVSEQTKSTLRDFEKQNQIQIVKVELKDGSFIQGEIPPEIQGDEKIREVFAKVHKINEADIKRIVNHNEIAQMGVKLGGMNVAFLNFHIQKAGEFSDVDDDEWADDDYYAKQSRQQQAKAAPLLRAATLPNLKPPSISPAPSKPTADAKPAPERRESDVDLRNFLMQRLSTRRESLKDDDEKVRKMVHSAKSSQATGSRKTAKRWGAASSSLPCDYDQLKREGARAVPVMIQGFNISLGDSGAISKVRAELQERLPHKPPDQENKRANPHDTTEAYEELKGKVASLEKSHKGLEKRCEELTEQFSKLSKDFSDLHTEWSDILKCLDDEKIHPSAATLFHNLLISVTTANAQDRNIDGTVRELFRQTTVVIATHLEKKSQEAKKYAERFGAASK